MKISAIFAAMLLGGAVGNANAGCVYQGVTYAHGHTLCFDGWLQECTVADYWKAIGMCYQDDASKRVPLVTLRDQSAPTKAHEQPLGSDS